MQKVRHISLSIYLSASTKSSSRSGAPKASDCPSRTTLAYPGRGGWYSSSSSSCFSKYSASAQIFPSSLLAKLQDRLPYQSRLTVYIWVKHLFRLATVSFCASISFLSCLTLLSSSASSRNRSSARDPHVSSWAPISLAFFDAVTALRKTLIVPSCMAFLSCLIAFSLAGGSRSACSWSLSISFCSASIAPTVSSGSSTPWRR